MAQLNLFPDLTPIARKGIGGSEIAALFGLSPWLSPRELWRLKAGLPIRLPVTPAQHRGVALEPLVCQVFEDRAGLLLTPGQRARHPRWAEGVCMTAATDRTLPDGGIFEAKTTHLGGKLHSAFMAGDIPTAYALQLQHYAASLALDRGVIACLAGPDDAMSWTPEQCDFVAIAWRALPELGALLEDAVRDFYLRFVFPRVQPDYPRHPRADDVLDLLAHAAWSGPCVVPPTPAPHR